MAARRSGSSGCCGSIFCSNGSTCRTRRWKRRSTIRWRCGGLLASTSDASRCRTRPRCAASAICSRSTIWPASCSTRCSGIWHPRPLAHQNGQVSLLAAAAAGARLRGLDTAGISRAMRIATTLLLTPSYTNAVAGATTLNVAGGMSGFAAALAPELALAGFEAQGDAIEEALGELVGSAFTSAAVLDELGMRWEITRNYFRLSACSNPIHSSLDRLHEVLAELHPRPDQIERIDIATYRFASVMRNPDPPNYFASKYSLPHAAAVMVVRGNAGFAELDDSALNDAA